jgi:hypothetical protein
MLKALNRWSISGVTSLTFQTNWLKLAEIGSDCFAALSSPET